jgi:hypothetical protein
VIPYYADDQITLWHGGALDALRGMPDGSVDCCVTSPPYYFIRDYGVPGQYGLEPTPSEYVANITAVMAECLRVLADDGTLWLNVDDVHSQRKAVRRSSHQEGLHGRRGERPSWRESRVAGLARMSYENVIDGRPVAREVVDDVARPDRAGDARRRVDPALQDRVGEDGVSAGPRTGPSSGQVGATASILQAPPLLVGSHRAWVEQQRVVAAGLPRRRRTRSDVPDRAACAVRAPRMPARRGGVGPVRRILYFGSISTWPCGPGSPRRR